MDYHLTLIGKKFGMKINKSSKIMILDFSLSENGALCVSRYETILFAKDYGIDAKNEYCLALKKQF